MTNYIIFLWGWKNKTIHSPKVKIFIILSLQNNGLERYNTYMLYLIYDIRAAINYQHLHWNNIIHDVKGIVRNFDVFQNNNKIQQ